MSKGQIVKYKKIITIVFIICLVSQVLLFFGINKLTSDSKQVSKDLAKSENIASETLIKDTVREQQRKMLSSIRQGWVQYLQLHPETEVILKDHNGRVIFSDGKTNVAFDENTMVKIASHNSLYSIKNKKDDTLILKNARPQWDKESVYKIFSIIACPTKAFGNGGNVTIFDSYTGEIIVDTRRSEDTSNTDRRYISLDYKDKGNKNPLYTKEVLYEQMMIKKDSDRQSDIISLSVEKEKMNNPTDNEKYPLGKYNREFIEKIILPYEFVGQSNEHMQMTVSLSSMEQDIFNPYIDAKKTIDDAVKKIVTISNGYGIYPTVSIIIVIIVVAVTLVMLNILYSKVHNE